MTVSRPLAAVLGSTILLVTWACVGNDPATSSSSSSSGSQDDGGSSSGGSSGDAAATCDAPKKTCGAACVDVLADDAHCGDCNTACQGTKCFNGICDGARVKQVSMGSALACVVRVDGSVWCWGRGAWGGFGKKFEGTSGEECLGVPADRRCSSMPVKVEGLPFMESVTTGYEAACAVSKDKEVWCWGRNANGETGAQAANETCAGGPCTVPPKKIANVPATVMQVALGHSHACSLHFGGEVWCWGDHTLGRLGRGNLAASTPAAPVVNPPPNATVIATSADGAAHTCVLSAGDVYCWGANAGKGLGTTTAESDCEPGKAGCSHTPKLANEIGMTADFIDISVTAQSTCALTSAGKIHCWGYDGYKVGSGTVVARPIEPASSFSVIAGGFGHVCALRTTGSIGCWGHADGARLGKTYPPTPPCVPGVTWTCNDGTPDTVAFNGAVAIDATENSIAMTADGRVFAWGPNNAGVLGKPAKSPLSPCDTSSGGPTCSETPLEVVIPLR